METRLCKWNAMESLKTLSSKTFSDLANARDMLGEQKRTQYVDEERIPGFSACAQKKPGGRGGAGERIRSDFLFTILSFVFKFSTVNMYQCAEYTGQHRPVLQTRL